MSDTVFELLERLCGLPGVSGWEDTVREEILRCIKGCCDSRVDALGNIIVFKKGARTPLHKVMLSAHMDEVGLIVTYAEESGLLRFETVGGIDRRALPGKMVDIAGARGVIGMKAVHMRSAEEKDTAPKVKDMYIDIGAVSREQALARVSLGDRAVFCSQYTQMGDGFLRARALDNRIGCAVLVNLLQSNVPYDLHAAFTVQEETGTTGARTAAAQIAPDIGLILETTTACDLPGVAPDKTVCELKKGPVLSFMDKGTVYDMDLYRQALKIASDWQIACQVKAGVYGGNESRSVQAAGAGARVLAVSVPCRNLHTPNCVAHRFDILQTARLTDRLVEAFCV